MTPQQTENRARQHPVAQSENGFTLMELSVVIAIVGLLAGFSAHMLTSGVETYDYLRERKEALETSRMALQRIVKEMRQASQATAIQKATADSLRYIKMSGESVQVRFANQSILINGQPLLDHVTQFSLSFFDGSGAPINFPITNTSTIWRIRLSFARSVRNQLIVLQQDVVPRNFRN